MTTEATRVVSRLLLPPTAMVAFGILVKGYADTGDGFSAGVILSLGILLQYLAFGSEAGDRVPVVKHAPKLAVIGLAVALAVTFLPVISGKDIMTHSPGPGDHVVHLGTVEVLTAVVFDIGVFLVVLGFAVGAIDLVAKAYERTYGARR